MKIDVHITDSPIEVPPLVFPSDGTNGAVFEFWGIVRGTENNQSIDSLHYESYPSMALKKMREILLKLSDKTPCNQVQVIHRIGTVPVGLPSLWIRASAPHRSEAIQLVDSFIIELKKEVPIWKKTQ